MGMRVKRYVWLCEDCLHPAVNGDSTALDFHYSKAEAEDLDRRITRGLRKLGPHLVPAYVSEDGHEETANPDVDTDFVEPCDCCGRAGLRFRRGYRFAILCKASKRYSAVLDVVGAALLAEDGCCLDNHEERTRVLRTIMERLHAAKLV